MLDRYVHVHIHALTSSTNHRKVLVVFIRVIQRVFVFFPLNTKWTNVLLPCSVDGYFGCPATRSLQLTRREFVCPMPHRQGY